jgi:hypothetical protein
MATFLRILRNIALVLVGAAVVAGGSMMMGASAGTAGQLAGLFMLPFVFSVLAKIWREAWKPIIPRRDAPPE